MEAGAAALGAVAEQWWTSILRARRFEFRREAWKAGSPSRLTLQFGLLLQLTLFVARRFPDSPRTLILTRFWMIQNRFTFTPGRFERWIESMNLTVRVEEVITSEFTRTPSPKKRTPSRRLPSVTPVAAKMISRPGANSSVRKIFLGSLIPMERIRSAWASSLGASRARISPFRQRS